ncbi:MAG: sulfotransferase family 2 domain-containing protein, partial [Pseudomonadota bacterium]
GRLQKSAQTAFYVAYEDLQDVDVMNGLAAFLGSDHTLNGLSKRLKKQNPAPLSEKVENFEDMERAVAQLDRFNLNRTPNFEPRRGPMVPQYVTAARAPLMYMPIKCGPTDQIEHWLADLDAVETGDLRRNLSQKDLRQWKRQNKGHRSFTVVRHPVVRAYDAFCTHILDTGPECYTEVRKTLRRVHNVPLPPEQPDDSFSAKDMRAAFIAFLAFLKANLSGQTALRVDPAWASQSHVVQGFADFAPPDVIVREEVLEDELAFLAAQTGVPYAPVRPANPNAFIDLSEIYDGHIEGLVRDAYQKDYLAYGFGRLDR